MTFLSLFTATVDPAELARTAEYEAAVRASLVDLPPIRVRFRGVTASAGAVLAQGHTDALALNDARDRLRWELRKRGLGDTLDSRYRLEAAHMTIVRFRAPLRDAPRFALKLESARTLDFGETEVDSLELVKSDWYQSRAATEHVSTYYLRGAG